MNNIEELSKPVGFVGLEGFSLLADGCLGVISPNLAFGEAPVYSHEYVAALIAQLEAAQKENGELVMSLNVANDSTGIWKDRAQKAEAELSAAQKERDEAIVLNKHLDLSIRKGEVVNSSLRERAEKAEAQSESNAIEIRKLGLQWSRAEKAETELSAANERLSKPVVLPELVVVNISGKYPIEVMYASKVKASIKAAGFTVEE
ncbi:hypothetical protein [Yersinia kristensenii]|uniref:hypothetical protein n=1 Tax=Yersinia kristensenii TaxID=28152 RepID=UPI0015625C13|nr:hypothetical protein [Yersinia kristensenii]QKJ17341.1 hypothetical protein HRD70_20455 [Yersinia kristensenii]